MECADFRRAAGETWEEKSIEACDGCTRCHGNYPINPDLKPDASIENRQARIVQNAFSLKRRRDSGFALNEGEMTEIEYRLLLTIDEITEAFERNDRIEQKILLKQQTEMLMAQLGIKKG